jgi:hypothetical protein
MITLFGIKDTIKDMSKGQSVDVETDLSARQLAPRLHYVTSTDGFHMCYRCATIPGGVRITCDAKLKITDVRVV